MERDWGRGRVWWVSELRDGGTSLNVFFATFAVELDCGYILKLPLTYIKRNPL